MEAAAGMTETDMYIDRSLLRSKACWRQILTRPLLTVLLLVLLAAGGRGHHGYRRLPG